MCFFSIIIPTYNSSNFIRKSIESVLCQNFKNFEIIVVDGFSTDGTLDIVSFISDSRIRFVSEIDFGVYDAMNKGIQLSRGEWIYFLGSDDVLFDKFVLQKIFNSIRSTSLPIVYGNVKIDGDTGWAKDGDIYAGFFSKNRMLKKSICHQSIFYERAFLIKNQLMFDLKYFVSADWDFNLCCRRLSKFKYVNIVIAVFKSGGISTLHKDTFSNDIESKFSDLYPTLVEIFIKSLFKKLISIFR